MKLESPKVTIEKSSEYLFNNLSDIKNFEKLMPENINKFEVTSEDAFIFGLQGMPEIKLKMTSKTPFSELRLGSASDKVPFSLVCNLTEISDNTTGVQLLFEGDFNPMMAMMIKGPIGKFMETLTSNMNKL